MSNYYLVKVSNSSTFEVRDWGDGADMVLVHEGPALPFNPKGLVMLHQMHANRSRPMFYHENEGTFECVHCGQRVNMSDTLFKLILTSLTRERYDMVKATAEVARVTIAHLVDTFPDGIPDNGYYAVKCDDVD